MWIALLGSALNQSNLNTNTMFKKDKNPYNYLKSQLKKQKENYGRSTTKMTSKLTKLQLKLDVTKFGEVANYFLKSGTSKN